MMHHVMVAGAGKIGSLIACLLIESGDYQVCLADKHFNGVDISRLKIRLPQLKMLEVDVENQNELAKALQVNSVKTIISSLPYFSNVAVAKIARELELNYFDLTEDVTVTTAIRALANTANTAFVPQCGLAPGFISIVANSLMQHFEHLDTVKLRVGALPQQVSNTLKYALTWSTDGLINEYGNACHAIENGEDITVLPLEGLETLILNGRFTKHSILQVG